MTNQHDSPPDQAIRQPPLWRDEDGTTAVEYAVMLGLIVAVCIGAVGTMATETKKSFDNSGNAIAGAIGN